MRAELDPIAQPRKRKAGASLDARGAFVYEDYMGDKDPKTGSKTGRTDAGGPAHDDRSTRLKAALKANMAKRKAQARARAAAARADDETEDG